MNMKASSVGQRAPSSVGMLMPGWPWREQDAGGNRRRVSLRTAVVYGRSLVRWGCETSMSDTAWRFRPKTELCSALTLSSTSGC